MNKLLITLSLLTFISGNAFASNRCYSPLEAEAEQGIRIHSELMVIGLNCQHMGKRAGQNLYGSYREFTARYAELFGQYETTMMDFFKKEGGKNPEQMLNTLRTKYANKISEEAAEMRPDVFCSRYAPRITKAAEMDRDAVRRWAGTIYVSHPVSYPVCAVQ